MSKHPRLTPQESRRAWLWAAVIVLLMALAGYTIYRIHQSSAFERAAIPQTDPASLAEASKGLDEISVSLAFDPEAGAQLTATQTLTLCNRTGEEQPAVLLRSWTGAYLKEETSPAASDELFDLCYGTDFSSGGLVLDSAAVNGAEADHVWRDTAHTVLKLPLAEIWQPGGVIEITLTWHATVPQCRSRFGQSDGIWALGNLLPLPAVWRDGAWREDAYCAVGDPFVSECANWHVTLSLPKGWQAATTGGYAHSEGSDLHWDALASRDFALVLSRSWQTATAQEGGITVTACAATREAASSILREARQALRTCGSRWGVYVPETLTLACVDFPYGGMEYPALVMLGSELAESGGQSLELTVAHEVAHQWWAVQVGSDSVNQPWQDESLAAWAMLTYIGDVYGAEEREAALFRWVDTAMRITIPRVTPGSPIDYFSGLNEYSMVVYQRGAALWDALSRLMGEDALNQALRDYQTACRFRIATREDLCALISAHAGMNLEELFADYLDTYLQ